MINIRKTFKEIFNNKIDALGLSVFRLLYALVMLCETSQIFRFRHVIYDKDPFVSIGEIDVTFIFFFWFIVLGMLMLGLFTRFSTILNYLFGVIIFSSANTFEYHIFYIYVGINFLIMFIPLSRVFSVDSLIQKIKYSNIGFQYKPNRKVLEINYLVLIFSAIAIVYFDSIFQKLSSPMWRSGLGLWLPSSLPMVTWNNTSVFLNQEIFMKFLGYFVLVFEGMFIFLFWFRKLRIPLMLIGIFFHIGILIIYPIPWFALSLIVVYLLMLPESFWTKISTTFKFKQPHFSFYYDSECPLCNKVIVAIKHFDLFNNVSCLSVQQFSEKEKALNNISAEQLLINIHGVNRKGTVFVGYYAYVQLFKYLIYTYPLSMLMSVPGVSFLGKKTYQKITGKRITQRCTIQSCPLPSYRLPFSENDDLLIKGWNRHNLSKNFWKWVMMFLFLSQCMLIWISPPVIRRLPDNFYLNKIPIYLYNNTKDVLRGYFGCTYHPVFLESHFKDFNHTLKITYLQNNKEKLVPLLDSNGMPDAYLTGTTWRNYSFNVISPLLCRSVLEPGLSPYLKYFLSQNKFINQKNEFLIYIKEYKSPQKWEKDFSNKQISQPWKLAGRCFVSSNEVYFEWSVYMKDLFKKEINTSHWLN